MNNIGPPVPDKLLSATHSKVFETSSSIAFKTERTPSDWFATFCLFTSKFFIYLIGISLVTVGLLFLGDGKIVNNGILLVMTTLISTGLLIFEFKKYFSTPNYLLAIYSLTVLVLFAAATFITGKLYDKSWDGMAYHQVGILELSKGWNPFYEQLPEQHLQSKLLNKEVNLHLYVNHYGKGMETFSAVLMAATGNIESGKVFHIILFLSSFCSLLYVLLRLNFRNKWWAGVLAFAAAFNPITVNQLFSYYIDSAVGALFLILIVNFVLLVLADDKKESKTPAFISIFLCVIILMNIKFTGVIYLAWLSAVFIGLLVYLKKSTLIKRFLSVVIPAGVVAVCVAGFNPYITNTVNFGHPFYPIAGDNKTDVIINMMPTPLEGANRFEKFFMSTFSRTDNSVKRDDQKIEYKIPFTFSVQELKTLQSEGVRLGGFGVLWSGILCVSVLLFGWLMFGLQSRERIFLIAITVAILGAVFINPVSWWARLVPQLWLFPVVVLVFMMLCIDKPMVRLGGRAITLLMIANASLILLTYSYSVYTSTQAANQVFSELHKAQKPVYAFFDIFTPNALKLEARNIPYIKVEKFQDLPCDEASNILKIEFCEGSK
jgi:hypothetical protein